MSSPEMKRLTPRLITSPVDGFSQPSVPWFNLTEGMDLDSPPPSQPSSNLLSQFADASDEPPILLGDVSSVCFDDIDKNLDGPNPLVPSERLSDQQATDERSRTSGNTSTRNLDVHRATLEARSAAPSEDVDDQFASMGMRAYGYASDSSSFDCESSSHELCDIPPMVCETVRVVTHDIRTTVKEESSVKECASSLTDQSLTG